MRNTLAAMVKPQTRLSKALSPVLDPINSVWSARSTREQSIVLVATVFLAVSAWYVLLIEPARAGTVRLSQSLPNTLAKSSQVEQLAAQVAALPKQDRAGSGATLNSKDAIEASLISQGISGTVSANAPYIITFQGVNGEALWQWVNTHSVRDAQLKRTATGNWQGQLTLMGQ